MQTEVVGKIDVDLEKPLTRRGRKYPPQRKQGSRKTKCEGAFPVANISAAELPELNDSDAENALSTQLARCMTTVSGTFSSSVRHLAFEDENDVVSEVNEKEEESRRKSGAPTGGKRRGLRRRRRNVQQNSSSLSSSSAPFPSEVRITRSKVAGHADGHIGEYSAPESLQVDAQGADYHPMGMRRLAPLTESMSISNRFLEQEDFNSGAEEKTETVVSTLPRRNLRPRKGV